MDRRVVVAIQRAYREGIPPSEIERALDIVESFAGALLAPSPAQAPRPAVAKASPPPVTKRPRGRPRSKSPKPPAARVAQPAAVADSRAEQARQALRTNGPMTAPQLQAALGLEEDAAHPLLARIGAKPVGEIELADGTVLKTYGPVG